jgi:FixJ family two-component response regulator
MPEVDGWAVMKRVFNSGSKLPIIFISAEKHENIVDRALQAGAVGFLQKPFEGQTLVDLIKVASASKTV